MEQRGGGRGGRGGEGGESAAAGGAVQPATRLPSPAEPGGAGEALTPANTTEKEKTLLCVFFNAPQMTAQLKLP